MKSSSFFSFIIVALILLSCKDNGTKELNNQIPNLKLPLKVRAEYFFLKEDSDNLSFLKNRLPDDTLVFLGQIKARRFTVYIKKKQGEIGPIIFTVDKKNKAIDTLFLFEKHVYLGTDSYYLPWIIINKKFEIIRTDTSSYFKSMISLENGKDISNRERFVQIDKFQINKFGYIFKKN